MKIASTRGNIRTTRTVILKIEKLIICHNEISSIVCVNSRRYEHYRKDSLNIVQVRSIASLLGPVFSTDKIRASSHGLSFVNFHGKGWLITPGYPALASSIRIGQFL